MRRTIFAGIVGAALIVPAAFPRADDTLHADEIIQALVGHKINGVTAKGDKWSGIYKPDGTAEYSNGNTGTWRATNDLFCDHPKGDNEYCRKVMRIGDKKYQMLKEDGSKGGTLTTD